MTDLKRVTPPPLLSFSICSRIAANVFHRLLSCVVKVLCRNKKMGRELASQDVLQVKYVASRSIETQCENQLLAVVK